MSPIGAAAVLAVATAASLAAQTAALSDAQVLAAIKIGESGRSTRLTASCAAHPSMGEIMTASLAGGLQRDGGYSVTLATAVGEVATRAAATKEAHRPMTIGDVTDDM